ncbi:MAG: hypothetical protein GWN71_23770, partial [Gammaproteobacteria bacterium]|nr:hypothetical protein [Gemmatimonadota bacterium]NIU76469.1 hypothetical protein [Gammaproteobacteria bacterium]
RRGASRSGRGGRLAAPLAAALALGLAGSAARADHWFAPEIPLAVGDEYDQPSGSATCARTLTADVVAIDQVIFFNRLGAFLPSGMIY